MMSGPLSLTCSDTAVADMNAHPFGMSRDVRGLEKMNNLIGQDLESLDINLRVAQDKLGDSILQLGE